MEMGTGDVKGRAAGSQRAADCAALFLLAAPESAISVICHLT